MIPPRDWEWFGHPGHFICAKDCRFHLCTRVGGFLVSTVGELFPSEGVREILARSRGIVLEGRGDEREASYMRQVGYQDIGLDRKYETMAFKLNGKRCTSDGCQCGLPGIIPNEIEFAGYNNAHDANLGHLRICEKVASEQEP